MQQSFVLAWILIRTGDFCICLLSGSSRMIAEARWLHVEKPNWQNNRAASLIKSAIGGPLRGRARWQSVCSWERFHSASAVCFLRDERARPCTVRMIIGESADYMTLQFHFCRNSGGDGVCVWRGCMCVCADFLLFFTSWKVQLCATG